MERKQIEFLISVFDKISELRNIGFDGHKTEVTLKECDNAKDYWIFDFKINQSNSKYEDCIVFYEGDDFDSEEILTGFDDIIEKAQAISK